LQERLLLTFWWLLAVADLVVNHRAVQEAVQVAVLAVTEHLLELQVEALLLKAQFWSRSGLHTLSQSVLAVRLVQLHQELMLVMVIILFSILLHLPVVVVVLIIMEVEQLVVLVVVLLGHLPILLVQELLIKALLVVLGLHLLVVEGAVLAHWVVMAPAPETKLVVTVGMVLHRLLQVLA